MILKEILIPGSIVLEDKLTMIFNHAISSFGMLSGPSTQEWGDKVGYPKSDGTAGISFNAKNSSGKKIKYIYNGNDEDKCIENGDTAAYALGGEYEFLIGTDVIYVVNNYPSSISIIKKTTADGSMKFGTIS